MVTTKNFTGDLYDIYLWSYSWLMMHFNRFILMACSPQPRWYFIDILRFDICTRTFCSRIYKIQMYAFVLIALTHWGRVTHICVSKQIIICSDNGLSPGPRQVIIWTNAGILLIGPLGTKFNQNSIKIHTLPFKEMHLKMSSGKWWPFCLGRNVLRGIEYHFPNISFL